VASRQSWAAQAGELHPVKVSSPSMAPVLPSQEPVGASSEGSRESFAGSISDISPSQKSFIGLFCGRDM